MTQHDSASGAERASASSGLEHLQLAALEMISALRGALDLAEDLLRDPPVAAAGAGISALVAEALQALRGLQVIPPAGQAPGSHPDPGSPENRGSPEDPRSRSAAGQARPRPVVEHIRVS